MSEHQVRAYTMSGAAMDVFSKLYNKGPQQDGDLPSKAGMTELIQLGLAKKDPKDAGNNMLTKLGAHEAGVYFTLQAVNNMEAGKPVELEVAGKTVSVDIDADDPDPASTLEFVASEVLSQEERADEPEQA